MTNQTALKEAYKSLGLAKVYADDGALHAAYQRAHQAAAMFLALATEKNRAMQDLMDGARKSATRKRGVSKKSKI